MLYHIYECTAVVKKNDIRKGCTYALQPMNQHIVETFSTKAEALEKLKTYHTLIILQDSSHVPLYKITEYYVQEYEKNLDYSTAKDEDIIQFSSFPSEYTNKWCVMDYQGYIAGKNLTKEAAVKLLTSANDKEPKKGWSIFHQIFDLDE